MQKQDRQSKHTMASSSLTISIFIISSFLILSSNAKTSPNPKGFIFPIRKDEASNQYYTSLEIGSNFTSFNAVIDLGGKFLWFNSPEYLSAAGSFRHILCGSEQCKLVTENPGCVFCWDTPSPRCSNNTCADYALNPFSGTQGYSGLGRDFLRARTSSGTLFRTRDFPFQFSDPVLLEGLPSPTAGVVGLGRTNISLPAFLSSAWNFPHRFELCIPSSGTNGNLVIGEAVYTTRFEKISTPLIRNPVNAGPSDQTGFLMADYFIGITSIRVGGKALALNKTLLQIDNETGGGGTNIRTVRPYTSLEKSIYDALVKEFVKAAAPKKMKRVTAVAPFTACFDSGTILSTKTGPDVPTVDLVLQSDKVYWRFYGSNSMVRVNEKVMCLAFVEGQPAMGGPSTSITVGGYQLENHLLEFDVSASELGFSSSLLLHDTTCSRFGAA